MTTPDSFPVNKIDTLNFDIINDLDSQETYAVIKPEFAAEFASNALKRMAKINQLESVT